MKRFFLILTLTAIAATLFAQTKTVKTQSLSLNLLGLQYNYEMPVSRLSTVTYYGGLVGELGYSSETLNFSDDIHYSDSEWMYSLRATVGAQYRFYYNLAKRAERGKNTRDNSSNFWAVRLGYYTPAFIEHNMTSSSIELLTPSWGLKRVYKNNWLFEFSLGYSIGFQGGDFVNGPSIGISVGYRL